MWSDKKNASQIYNVLMIYLNPMNLYVQCYQKLKFIDILHLYY